MSPAANFLPAHLLRHATLNPRAIVPNRHPHAREAAPRQIAQLGPGADGFDRTRLFHRWYLLVVDGSVKENQFRLKAPQRKQPARSR